MTEFFENLNQRIKLLGGKFNAHLHIDRVNTYSQTLSLLNIANNSGSSLSLAAKHGIIPTIHKSSAYDVHNLKARVKSSLLTMASNGTTRADSVVDVTDDRVQLSALNALLEVKEEIAETIDFRLGVYNPFGFSNDQPKRWSLFERGVPKADFIGSLPERDDHRDYPNHIGFERSIRDAISLSFDVRKPVHIHVDQQNHDREFGCEIVAKVVEQAGFKHTLGEEPLVWLVHAISPATFEEARFRDLAEKLAALNIGIICCPSAAISMRQLRPLSSPTGNSIARVLDFLDAGVWVRLGSDNVCDITSPAGTLDITDEVFVLCNALRFYDPHTLSLLAAGKRLDSQSRLEISNHLIQDRQEIEAALARYERIIFESSRT